MSKYIFHNHNHDGVDRRGFLECMAWAGTGVLYVLKGGILRSYGLNQLPRSGAGGASGGMEGGLSFVQISDSHMGFNKPANSDVVATLQAAVDKINALGTSPAFLLHTGDISHLSKPQEFDTVDQLLRGVKTNQMFYVPGEHDVLTDDGRGYLDRYAKQSRGMGWYSFDHSRVHFIGLVNVMNLKAGGLGTLGSEQLEWLAAYDAECPNRAGWKKTCFRALPTPLSHESSLPRGFSILIRKVSDD